MNLNLDILDSIGIIQLIEYNIETEMNFDLFDHSTM